MHCRSCGLYYDHNAGACPRCQSDSNKTSWSTRIWLIAGISLLLLSGVILGSTFWYVSSKRAYKVANSQTTEPQVAQSINVAAAPTIKLQDLSRQQLLDMVPVHILSRFRSPSSDTLPDDLRVFNEGEDQYVVMVGSRESESKEMEKAVVVFKLEGGSLSDVSREVLPADLPQGRVCSSLCDLKFYNKAADIELALPVTLNSSPLNEDCANCEHAYMLQELSWCTTGYELGTKMWRNDAYTAVYLTAQALNRKSVNYDERIFIDHEVDAEISKGFEKDANIPWKAQNVTEAEDYQMKNLDSFNYTIGNGTNAVYLTVSKIDGRWRTMAIERK